jgi:hypothetical protein
MVTLYLARFWNRLQPDALKIRDLHVRSPLEVPVLPENYSFRVNLTLSHFPFNGTSFVQGKSLTEMPDNLCVHPVWEAVVAVVCAVDEHTQDLLRSHTFTLSPWFLVHELNPCLVLTAYMIQEITTRVNPH